MCQRGQLLCEIQALNPGQTLHYGRRYHRAINTTQTHEEKGGAGGARASKGVYLRKTKALNIGSSLYYTRRYLKIVNATRPLAGKRTLQKLASARGGHVKPRI
jgi:hypothetical protein